MKYFVGVCCLFVLALLGHASSARADAALLVDEPAVKTQSTEYDVQVLDDGFAVIHLKWADQTDVAKRRVDLSLSEFTTASPPSSVVVAIDAGQQAAQRLTRKEVE